MCQIRFCLSSSPIPGMRLHVSHCVPEFLTQDMYPPFMCAVSNTLLGHSELFWLWLRSSHNDEESVTAPTADWRTGPIVLSKQKVMRKVQIMYLFNRQRHEYWHFFIIFQQLDYKNMPMFSVEPWLWFRLSWIFRKGTTVMCSCFSYDNHSLQDPLYLLLDTAPK